MTKGPLTILVDRVVAKLFVDGVEPDVFTVQMAILELVPGLPPDIRNACVGEALTFFVKSELERRAPVGLCDCPREGGEALH